MAEDTIAFLERIVGGPAHLVGCSAGASVALLVALRRPDLARHVVLVSGVFHRDGWLPGAIDPDAPPHEVLARGYAELSPDGRSRHVSRAPPRKAGALQLDHRRLSDNGPGAHVCAGSPR
jgi:pimeloyl-ACP methyl ester carboxylesterase